MAVDVGRPVWVGVLLLDPLRGFVDFLRRGSQYVTVSRLTRDHAEQRQRRASDDDGFEPELPPEERC